MISRRADKVPATPVYPVGMPMPLTATVEFNTLKPQVDLKLDDNSSNPIANFAVTEKFNEIEEVLENLQIENVVDEITEENSSQPVSGKAVLREVGKISSRLISMENEVQFLKDNHQALENDIQNLNTEVVVISEKVKPLEEVDDLPGTINEMKNFMQNGGISDDNVVSDEDIEQLFKEKENE